MLTLTLVLFIVHSNGEGRPEREIAHRLSQLHTAREAGMNEKDRHTDGRLVFLREFAQEWAGKDGRRGL